MNKQHFLLIFLIFTTSIIFAKPYTISGYITINKSGETLINSTVFEKKSGSGTVSNSYGFYSITLPKGNVDLKYSYVGLTTQSHDFYLDKDTVINIRLSEGAELSEVTVLGNSKGVDVRSSQMSVINIPIAQIKTVPSLMGENDVIKALQLLPGVKAGVDGSAGMYVRGGGPDENLLLLDGVPVYNVNHLFGFFSVFNADAIKDVTLYKGSFPARFGDRLSSVVDIRMNDGDNQHYHGNITVGLIASKLNFEGPLFSNKTTFNISARRTYADLLLKPFISKTISQNNGGGDASFAYYFYDINAKISHTFSDKDRLYLSAYSGDDVITTDMQQYAYKSTESSSNGRLKMGWYWGNVLGSLRWNHVINNKLFMNTTASYTRYRFDLSMGTKEITKFVKPDSTVSQSSSMAYKSGIEDFTAKADFDWSPNPNHDIKFGANCTFHSFQPNVTVVQDKTTQNTTTQLADTTIGDPKLYSQETSAYFEDDIRLGSVVQLNAGLHFSGFLVQNKLYTSLPQPRVGLRILLSDNLSFKAGYASMSQYVHLLSSSNVSLPTDLWVPVTKRIPPMQSNQYSAGIFYNFRNIVNFSVESYYKSMNNLIEYQDGASFMGSTTGWEDKVYVGRGRAYGIEFLAQKTVGKTTGWIGYTWSKSERLFDRPGQEINDGLAFPSKYDRRHDVSLVVAHKFSSKFDIGATWVYSTGNCGTLALQNFKGTPIDHSIETSSYIDVNNPAQSQLVQTLPYVTSRNNYRYNPYHRLDVSVNFHKQLKHGIRTWNISVYNAYDNFNPFITSVKTTYIYGAQITAKHTLTQLSILPIIPSVSYSYKF
ncbi:MAG: TonB-dependent receptor plug domain-containing protein [Paludibacter sp.]|nr:TonB-dependent receptor plug domain-containing protein [Paludibacter sp.]